MARADPLAVKLQAPPGCLSVSLGKDGGSRRVLHHSEAAPSIASVEASHLHRKGSDLENV